eukprot:m.82504 g.82504  ORF g.82504 m.82504 type:complete len:424 (-) comp14922_c0_seq1:246-1517(-)
MLARAAASRSAALSATRTSVARMATRAGSAVNSLIQTQLDEIKAAGTWKAERIITTPQSANIGVQSREGKVLNFCANNYLGLADNAKVIAAAKRALDSHGNGLGSVRFICGTQDIHKNLERKVAQFHGMEDTILYASCFDANAGIFEALLGPDDAVISDELNHASIIDGIRLCKANKARYLHRDMADLEKKLQEMQDKRIKLIVTDGVFSMDGNVAPLAKICDLADKYGALVMIDECHATGFFGATGRGTPEHCGVTGRIDIINSTFGKALGGALGGYTTASTQIVSLLRQKSRPYLFSNSLPPSVVGATTEVLDLISRDSSLPKKVHDNTQRFRSGMTKAGFKLGGDQDHPICPIMLGDARLAVEFADEMLKRGIFVIGFSFPVVPKGKARIRVQISAAHSAQDIDRAVAAFVEVGKAKQVI